MAIIGSFFRGRSRKAYVAAQQDRATGTLYYHESDSLTPIPPSVYVWAYVAAKKLSVYPDIMVNYPATWMNTYKAYEKDYYPSGRFEYSNALAVTSLASAPWSEFNLTGLGAKPNLSSIYDDTLSRAESRARRVYMLASFAILKKHGRKHYASSQGHNIGSILAAKDGEVLSWGVNTGGFRHAEVNTLLGYFAKNPDKATLPAQCVLFTTLKPCLMCSTLIKNAQNTGSDAKIWYGMIDEGKQGGTPLLGDKAKEFTGQDVVDMDVFELMSKKGTLDTAIKVTGTKPVLVPQGKTKVDLTKELNQSGGGHGSRRMSAADWVDRSDEVWDLVEASVTKLQGKADRANREDGPMKATLNYLKGWAF